MVGSLITVRVEFERYTLNLRTQQYRPDDEFREPSCVAHSRGDARARTARPGVALRPSVRRPAFTNQYLPSENSNSRMASAKKIGRQDAEGLRGEGGARKRHDAEDSPDLRRAVQSRAFARCLDTIWRPANEVFGLPTEADADPHHFRRERTASTAMLRTCTRRMPYSTPDRRRGSSSSLST